MKSLSNFMPSKLHSLCLGLLLLCSTSCNDFLDTKPTDFLTPDYSYQTLDQLNRGLVGVYDILGNSEIYGEYMGVQFNGSTDETYCSSDGEGASSGPTGVTRVNFYGANDVLIEAFWKKLYEGIGGANSLLYGMETSTVDETAKSLIRGQTLFLRGYFYFLLVQHFGDVPLIITPTTSVDNTALIRSPIKDVYAQILQDMTTAESLLQNYTITSIGHSERVTKTAVQGILARVCLNMAGFPLQDVSKYSEVIKWTDKVINSGEHALAPDYKQIFINYAQDKYDIKESIWEVGFSGNRTSTTLEEGRIGNQIGIRCDDPAIGVCYNFCRMHKPFYDLFEPNNSSTLAIKPSYDLRREWNCARYQYKGTTNATILPITNLYYTCTGKFRREYETLTPKNLNWTPINFPILRYADILLMRAEAENEKNGPGLAYEYVNTVRKRGYGILYGNIIRSISVINGGAGYSTVPIVTISGGGGSGATAVAVTNTSGVVTGISITNPGTITNSGSYFTSIPTITISGGGGSGATAVANITSASDADLSATQMGSMLGLKKAIEDERSRELCMESLRRYDLIRWGIYLSTMSTLANTIDATYPATQKYASYAAKQLSPKYVLFPIPQRELNVNSKLTQNPGW